MLLEGKSAVIYGGAGAIGAGVAELFAREGARVFLAGRTAGKLDAVAERIRHAGGSADADELDARDEKAVDEHADQVVERGGSLDISFNLIEPGYVQGTPMVEMELDDYLEPITNAVASTFVTWRAAGRHMARQGSGVILAFGGEGRPAPGVHLGALQTALHAVEAMRRQFATELGASGVRVVTLRTGGVPETLDPDLEGRERIADSLAGATLLGRPATIADVARVAAFVASDQARTMTAATVNVSAGTIVD